MDGGGLPARAAKVDRAQVSRQAEMLHMQDSEQQQLAAAWFRGVLRLPDELKQNCVDDIVRLMPRFVQLLSSPNQTVMTEAASVIANIAASPGESSSHTVIESGAVPLLVSLIGSTTNNDLKDHAALALGNVAIGSAQARDHVIECGGTKPLLAVMKDFVAGASTSARVLNSTVWTVSQLCRAVPRPSVAVLEPLVPVLCQLLVTAGDEEVLVDACWAISYLAEDFAYLEVVCQPEVVKVVVNLLGHPSNGVRTAAVRASGNFVTGNDRQTQIVIDAGGLDAFGKLVESPVDEHCKDAVWAISNIAAGTQEQIQRVIDAKLIPKLVRAWHTRCETVKTESAWALCNFCTGGSAEQFKYLMSQRHAVTPLVCVLLESKDSALAAGARNAVDAITKAGEEERLRNSGEYNEYAKAVERAQKARTAFLRAQRCESEKNWNAAIDAYTEAMGHYWNPEKCHNRMGICYSKLAKHAEAFAEYDAVLKINPQDGVGYCNRGRKHLALGRYAEAEADALQSLKLNPKHKTSQQLLLDARKKLSDEEPPSSEAELYSTAEKLRKHKQWSAAIDAFTELLDTDYPGKAHLLNQRGVCYQELGQHEEALKDLTESLELDPTQPVSKLCNRADVFRDLERFSEAVDDLTRVIELAPDDAAAKAQLAEVHTAMAVPPHAREAFKHGRQLYNEDKWEKAIESFTQSIASGLGKSETYTSWVMRGWCYHQVGNLDESLREFDMAVTQDPTRVVGWYSRGMAHKRLGHMHQSKEDCDHAVDLTWEDLARASLEDFGLPPLGVEEQMCDVPEGIRVFFTQLAGAVIGDEMFGMRCFEAAVAAYSLALRSTANATLVVPRDALCRWHFQRGRCFLLLRRHVEALSDFSTVISKVPENKPKVADAHFFRGHLHSQADRWVDAEQDLKKCLELNPDHDTAQQLLTSTQEKLSSRARSAEEAEKELLAQLQEDEEREKKKREKNKEKKQRQKEKKKKHEEQAKSASVPALSSSGSSSSSTATHHQKSPDKSSSASDTSSPSLSPEAKSEVTSSSGSRRASNNSSHQSASRSKIANRSGSSSGSVPDKSAKATTHSQANNVTQSSSPLPNSRSSHAAPEENDSGIESAPAQSAPTSQSVPKRRGSSMPSDTVRKAETVPAVMAWGSNDDEDAAIDSDCPLCCEPFDDTDIAFTPCPCGYKVCIWCYHRLKDDIDGQCPACRQGYHEVEQKMVKVLRSKQDPAATARKEEAAEQRKAARVDEAQELRELFASTSGGLRQSELDSSVVDLLQKLEPAMCKMAVEKFKSVTTWATIRNKSGFVTAEIQKLRAQMPASAQPPSEKSVVGSEMAKTAGGISMGHILQGRSGSGGGGAPAATAGAARVTSSPSKSSWAAAVSSSPTASPNATYQQPSARPAVTRSEEAEKDEYPAHALCRRLGKELEALPGGKQTRRERKRLTQRIYETEHSDNFQAEERAISAATGQRDDQIGNMDASSSEGGKDSPAADMAVLAGHVWTCVQEHYTNGSASLTASSRFVALVDEPSWKPVIEVSGDTGSSAVMCARPLLQPGTLSSIDYTKFDAAPVSNFLGALGLAEYASAFALAEVDADALKLLDEADLRTLGVQSASARQRLMEGITVLSKALPC